MSGVTGNRPDSLATASVLEAVVPASAVDPDYVGTYPDFVGTHPEPLRVTVVTTTTRDGARVRTSRLAGSTDDAPWTYLERLAAVPAADPHALLPLPSGKHPGFVAIAPDGAIAELVTRRRPGARQRHDPRRAWPRCPPRRTPRAPSSGCGCGPPTATSSTTPCPRSRSSCSTAVPSSDRTGTGRPHEPVSPTGM